MSEGFANSWSQREEDGAGTVRAQIAASPPGASSTFRRSKPAETQSSQEPSQRHSRELEESVKRLADLIANVPGVVWEWYTPEHAPPDRANYVSPYVQTMLGFARAECEEADDLWVRLAHPDDREMLEAEQAAILDSGQGRAIEFRCKAMDGRTIWVQAQCSVIRGGGECIGIRGVAIDITAHKHYEQVLRERASELAAMARALKQSNEELDQFAYVTSHDLKAPLRGIANLSQWIEEDIGKSFPPEAHQQMNLLRGRVHRMEAMIDGLLQYSRVGRLKGKIETVAVASLLAEMIELLAPPASFTIEVEPGMPTLQTDKLRLQQVFQNLVGNTIKHNPRPDGRVQISGRDAGDFYEFSVTDNGPGIPAQYREKIFVIFQTLQARDRVEGTGIGLSLVKKIVETFGGAIAVDSADGGGAVFRFTWPKRID